MPRRPRPSTGPADRAGRADCARELCIDLLAGSFLERVAGAGEALQHLASTSTRTARSRPSTARSTCSTSRSAGSVYRESDIEEPGEEIVCHAPADGVELGTVDLLRPALPELYRILAVRGARVIAVPSAFTLATTRDHWETLVRARAIENQAS